MAGNMVRYAGVQVGTVKGLTVSDSGIEVVAEINDNVQIPQEATFTIGADGILGAFWARSSSISSRLRVR